VVSGDHLASIAVGGDARPNDPQAFAGTERFNSWAQRGAIFKQAPHKAGAKLFLSWPNARTTQQNAIATWTWSVRKDIAPPAGLKALSSYKNTDPAASAAPPAPSEPPGEINRLDTGYAYRDIRGPDGQVHGLNVDPQGSRTVA
jgi:hypothetical protein